ncbi:NAD(P)/FAD-dependent oxidoreductase [Pseudonocardia sp. KRD-184]|uniref:NAD(P)/FAD-dependent oxidoreductase n=1 Tax=Pseudonocardia oceani TaxID=2792013 RepID=A0ABS6U492_9PSEU|nr:FAD/NAD(P)-binding oxidoreductase [Pseudonocardia oceani]MBW0091617.1 NAD(P)/FAD-dependent oxidoreductase [Pseudonocardia oceani]MBW0098752.1 NAD(P)/FAD-dependent oxidoreductase [Pseudonocardia oceani]MBW0125137.1 NAD(P)/FAD-dependent oxidoreductase [Pseudonocardia oceani]MBW0127043.1 NAD(P)/FAD-dependent oxidoreductase [Pseudonocardia oceani]
MARHKIVIVGGGSAGLTVAARLRRQGQTDVAVIDPASTHYYQPLWTLVGGGRAPVEASAKPQSKVMPKGVTWIQRAAVGVDPDTKEVALDDGSHVGYEYLVMCPGIQLDWEKITGLGHTLGRDGVSSNYLYELAPATWKFIRETRSGTAVFTMPAGPIKCAGAPQKIAYLAADYWREQGVLDKMDIHLVLPTPGMFGVKEFSDVLVGVAKRYGITVHLQSEAISVNSDAREVTIADRANDSEATLGYDVMHMVPPQSAPDWVEKTSLADPASPAGYIEIDKHTMQHTRYPDVFALGDAGSSPNSKTGAAIRKQAPVVVANLVDVMAGRAPSARYEGYASCPLTTSRHSMLLAEFDYSMKPKPSIPVINTIKERRDMWYLKRYGLPALYWQGMLRGVA